MAYTLPSEQTARRDSAKEFVAGLYSEWYGPLVRYACRATGSMDAAEDIVQASFVELYRAMLEGKAIGNARGWTLCVVRREIVDRHREQQRHGGAFVPLSDDCLPASSPPFPAPAGWEDADLTRLLSVLSAREEEVLLLRVKALKYRQIATELRISVNSVKTLLSRAIRKMQQARSNAMENQGSWKRHGDTIPKTLQ